MRVVGKIWYRYRKYQIVIALLFLIIIIQYVTQRNNTSGLDLDLTRRYIELTLQEALKEDRGSGCDMPKLDPFAKEIMQFQTDKKKINCPGKDWVKCYLSECRVVKDILDTMKNIECTYRDILYESDAKYTIGPPAVVKDDSVQKLVKSDHVRITCTGIQKSSGWSSKWTGHAVGFRATVKPQKPPKGRERTLNVLILGFDSTSRNGFIRRMTKSYKVLKDELQATILTSYNILGDGTPAALIPILTGKEELELPESRMSMRGSGYLDAWPFLFYKLKNDGYRTAYLEDMPLIGTFQYRFNGFLRQPTDHYMRAFYLEELKSPGHRPYCLGDSPQYKVMLNITEQFFKLDGKRFAFTFIADITHEDFNMIAAADDDLADFLRGFKRQGFLKNTMLIVMGDHGPRYHDIRKTTQGQLEERLPLMAIVLPDDLKVDRPDAQNYLNSNADTLTTPHDIYATVVDVLEMSEHKNPYKVKGSDLTRGFTLLETIPRNRSCSEADIEPHWCACANWKPVAKSDPMYQRAANAFIDFINGLTAPLRSRCVPRTLTVILWVTRQHINSQLVQFLGALDQDGYLGKFDPSKTRTSENYQIKVAVGPGHGVYEATMTHFKMNDSILVQASDISRINAYNSEPACISSSHPHLNKYCFCND